MRYKPLSFIIIIVAFLFIAFDSSQFLRSQTLALTDKMKIWVSSTQDSIKLAYEKYLHQASTIETYKKELQDYTKTQLELQALQTRFEELSDFIKQKAPENPDFISTRAFSYVGIGDYNRIWLDFDIAPYPKSKIFGIVQNGNAIGIATIKNNRLMGLLNGDENCSYAVYIGDQKTPAIIRYDSSDPEKILADFIPSWLKINLGDEVKTSGLDGIFTPGIPVGQITSITQNYGYITAEVSPYAKKNHLDYMWLVDTKIIQMDFDPPPPARDTKR
ncbi:rod shape-determining protein MreC [Helicobacter sp. 11S02596-1]|uniref:rod shape-determining protein MreC n=1 Tax=Helicobacter sp. 11S02596-1 TaxID=1476194 RepID=UPI000BA56782|nr:rod shape-determining protein MreC [Helicobacter sp. 11S02596-1]PAF44790.1 rod shape-determining protein MreC [Helicobacter sp. 11S02596-1]